MNVNVNVDNCCCIEFNMGMNYRNTGKKMEEKQEIIELRAKIQLIEKRLDATLDLLEQEGIIRKSEVNEIID